MTPLGGSHNASGRIWWVVMVAGASDKTGGFKERVSLRTDGLCGIIASRLMMLPTPSVGGLMAYGEEYYRYMNK